MESQRVRTSIIVVLMMIIVGMAIYGNQKEGSVGEEPVVAEFEVKCSTKDLHCSIGDVITLETCVFRNGTRARQYFYEQLVVEAFKPNGWKTFLPVMIDVVWRAEHNQSHFDAEKRESNPIIETPSFTEKIRVFVTMPEGAKREDI